jgi:hypothetical protein
MTTEIEDISQLHQELTDEFFFYADKKKSESHLATPWYWFQRGPAFLFCGANMPGTKFLISTDDPSELSDLVPRAYMFADHVLVRHRKLMPPFSPSGVYHIDYPPGESELEPLRWTKKRHESGEETRLKILPHFRRSPDEDAVKGFVDWFCGPGRSWLQQGCLSYVPNLIPQEVETGLLAEDCNLASALLDAKIIPQANKLINDQTATALVRIPFPCLTGANAETLKRFKEDECEAIEKFQSEVLLALGKIEADAHSPEFARSVEKIFVELREKLRDAERAIELQAKSSLWGRLQVELLFLTAEFLFCVGAPSTATIAAVSAGAVRLAQELRDSLKDRYSLRQNPMYAMAKLNDLRRNPK